MEKVGWSGKEWTRQIEREEGTEKNATRIMRDLNINKWREDLKKSRYAGELKEIIGREERVYGTNEVKRTKDALQIVARFRMGNETKACRFWNSDEERMCRLCKKEIEDIVHVVEKCEITGKKERNWKRILKIDKTTIAEMKKILWTKKCIEKDQ